MKYERKGHGRPDRILTRARQPLGQPTPERLEENLRWLIHVTLPPVQAPERLRRRIQAMADAHRAWLDSEQAARDRLREWAGLDTGLTAPEREAVSLLLTTDLQPFEEDSLLRDEARPFCFRHVIGGIGHLERDKDVIVEIILELLPGHHLDQPADVGAIQWLTDNVVKYKVSPSSLDTKSGGDLFGLLHRHRRIGERLFQVAHLA